MTRTILTVALAAIFGVGGTIASRIQTAPEEEASELALKNIEALGDDENSGKPCYNKGNYDITKPDAMVCDDSCKLLPWNTPISGGTSHCL